MAEDHSIQMYIPEQAATATGQDGVKKVFLRLPHLARLIQDMKADPPDSFSYRWAFHLPSGSHVLLVGWPNGAGVAVGLPEETADPLLRFMTGETDIFLTTEPVAERLQGEVADAVINEIILGETVGLTGVRFGRRLPAGWPGPGRDDH